MAAAMPPPFPSRGSSFATRRMSRPAVKLLCVHKPDHSDAAATADLPAPSNISEAIAQVVREAGAHVFGLVGNGNIHFVNALPASAELYTSTRHEAGAIAAADAYYRCTGEIAVASTTYGPGFTNALTPLSEAQAARIPMVCIMGDVPTTGLRPIDVDQRAILSALGVRFLTAQPHNAADIARRAFELARRLSAPVVVLTPHDQCAAPLADAGDPADPCGPDVTGAPAREGEHPESLAESAGDPTAAVDEVARALRAAQRPLILVGRAVVETGTVDLVERIGAATGALFLTSAMARECVGPDFSLGIAGGYTHRGRLPTVRSADLVLVLGASLNLLQTRKGTLFNADARIIQVDRESRQGFIAVDRRIRADVREFLPRLVDVLGTPPPRAVGWRREIGTIPPAETEQADPGCFGTRGPDGKLDPRHALRRLNDLLPRNRTVVTDGGHFLGWVPKYIDCPDPRSTVLVGTAVMTIGLGLASAVGTAVGRQDRCTTLFTGDGGTLMALADLDTLIRVGRLHQVPGEPAAVITVLNDEAYGAEVHQYVPQGLDDAAMLVHGQRFAAMGDPWGAPGLTVEDPEQLAAGGEVQRFLADHSGQVCILDVRISREVIADFLRE
ncbi:acetyltransferase [Corynebacterium heidelbergense]|uniref:acetolactate synthase n=1 Tax=Corynebacterium heidelbergense TaxID=2055947 RepID=A0A364V8Z4_9CORY|nr:acetyltransferase [Corynebacterium heidelbergense]